MSDRFVWTREAPLAMAPRRKERWSLVLGGGPRASFEIEATYGKRIDIAAVKQSFPFQAELAFLERKRRFFEERDDFVPALACPVCGSGIGRSVAVVTVWKATYRQCPRCSHLYADRVPGPRTLEAFYAETLLEREYYAQPDEIELRLQEIYAPKLEWAAGVYRDVYGREPRSVADLGAGTGHFLYAAKRRGLSVGGVEIDEAHTAFAKQAFGIDLHRSAGELRKAAADGFDIVTSFNVIEHLGDPGAFLDLHASLGSGQSLVVVETPKFESLTIWLQRLFPTRIRGYLVPYEHIQIFTEASLATLLVRRGFVPSHVWIFGQDARELFFQLHMETGRDFDDVIRRYFDRMQEGFDLANFSDLMVFAARPPAR